MKNLIIYGAGGFGREIMCWFKDEVNFKGFLDDDKHALSPFGMDRFYLGNKDNYTFCEDDYLVIAIANPKIKQRLYHALKQQGVNFTNLIHKTAIIGDRTILGEGNIICPYTIISVDVKMQNCNAFNLHTSIGHDANIGSFNIFNSHNDITGNTNIGDRNFFGSSACVLPNAIIGHDNKIAAQSVVYKGMRDNNIYIGNPARKVGNNE